MSDVHLIRASATSIPLPDESVQCVVTSPPYWGLRSFAGDQNLIWESGNWRGAYGLEPTVEMYVEHTVQILREIRRVLRKDGVVFWNIGDSYCSGAYTARPPSQTGTDVGGWTHEANQIPRNGKPDGLKPKDLVLMPARVALAAQADGWWVRSMIIWAKPNPMPESVTDRPTDSYEHIILLAKSERYFWDATAVREETTGNAHHPGYADGGPKAREREKEGTFKNWRESTPERFSTRNMRNVWMFATQPYSGAHFATFPEELPRRCILAATSEKGACAQCGTPWRRISRQPVPPDDCFGQTQKEDDGLVKSFGSTGNRYSSGQKYQRWLDDNPVRTIGWQPGCRCRGQHNKTVPCIVLDPFGGSGTTGRVALELNRTAYLVDVAYGPDGYEKLARERTTGVQRNLVGL